MCMGLFLKQNNSSYISCCEMAKLLSHKASTFQQGFRLFLLFQWSFPKDTLQTKYFVLYLLCKQKFILLWNCLSYCLTQLPHSYQPFGYLLKGLRPLFKSSNLVVTFLSHFCTRLYFLLFELNLFLQPVTIMKNV